MISDEKRADVAADPVEVRRGCLKGADPLPQTASPRNPPTFGEIAWEAMRARLCAGPIAPPTMEELIAELRDPLRPPSDIELSLAYMQAGRK